MLWILVFLAATAAGFSSVEFTVESRPRDPTMIGVFAASLFVVALGMFVEAKRDLYGFCFAAVVLGFVTSILTGAVALLGASPHPIAAAVAVLSGGVVIACVVYLVRTQYGRDPLPDILRQRFDAARIAEVEGVQFAVCQSATELVAGEALTVEVVAQNCWDEERRLTFELRPETRVSINRAGLRIPGEPRLVLPAASVAVLAIPVVAEPKADGRFVLVASPKVSGEGGKRVRRRRARALSTHIPPWLTLLLLFGGMFVWGGGLKLRVRVTPRRGGAEPPPVVALEPRTRVIWQPEPDALAAARGVAA
jgi:hypothetical protein